jgi:hypothetical protein
VEPSGFAQELNRPENFQVESKRFDLKPGELLATILEVYQLTDRDRQSILLAVDAAVSKKERRKLSPNEVTHARSLSCRTDSASNASRRLRDSVNHNP